VPSYFNDLRLLAASEQRAIRGLENPALRGRDGGVPDDPTADVDLAAARQRLAQYRDISSSSSTDFLRPSAPGRLADLYGQASRQVGRLAAALEQQPLLPGMVDTSSSLMQITGIPRLSGGAAVAIQSSQNAGIQETDPTSTSVGYPVGTIAGQVDMSRQLFELSRPGMDAVISADLGRATGVVLDSQLVSGSGSAGQLRGLASTSGIVTTTTTSTTAQGQISAIWGAFNVVAGSTGFGSPDPEDYLLVMHPRRYAFISSGSGGTGAQTTPHLPGQLVLSGGLRTNLGASTSEDEVYLVDKSQLLLVGGRTQFSVFEETGSGTSTVRICSHASAALIVKNPAASVRLSGSGLVTPTF
jgi:hypothetical protein